MGVLLKKDMNRGIIGQIILGVKQKLRPDETTGKPLAAIGQFNQT